MIYRWLSVRHVRLGAFGRGLLTAVALVGWSSSALASVPARIYVTDRASTVMYVIDAATLNTIAEVPVAGDCGRPAIHPDESRVYVGCWGTNLVYEVSASTLTVQRTFALERQPVDLVVTQDGRKLFVANRLSQSLSSVDLATGVVNTFHRLSEFSFWSLVAGSDDRAYASSWGKIFVIDTANDAVVGQLPGPGGPGELVLSPEEDRLYAADGNSGLLIVVDLASATVVALIPGASQHGDGLALSPDGRRAYMTHANTGGGVSVFDTESLTRIARYPSLGIYASGIDSGAEGHCLYVRSQHHLLVLRAVDGQVFTSLGFPFNGSVAVSSGSADCGQLVEPQITWTPTALVYGQPLGSLQLNATANVPGSFSFQPSAGVVLDAGVHQLTLVFNPQDTSRYRPVSATSSLTVSAAIPSVQWTTPAPIIVGTPLGPAQLAASANATGTFTYEPTLGSVLPAGVHTLHVSFVPQSANFVSTTAEVTLAITHGVCLLYDPARPVRRGSVLPLKLRLCDAAGNNLSTASTTVRAEGVTFTPGAVEGVPQDAGQANPDSNFRYSAELDGYIYNLQTSNFVTGRYTVNVRVGSEPILHALSFQVK